MTIDEFGNWVADEARYALGGYQPKEEDIDWEAYGAEGPPGGDIE